MKEFIKNLDKIALWVVLLIAGIVAFISTIEIGSSLLKQLLLEPTMKREVWEAEQLIEAGVRWIVSVIVAPVAWKFLRKK